MVNDSTIQITRRKLLKLEFTLVFRIKRVGVKRMAKKDKKEEEREELVPVARLSPFWPRYWPSRDFMGWRPSRMVDDIENTFGSFWSEDFRPGRPQLSVEEGFLQLTSRMKATSMYWKPTCQVSPKKISL
jgi:hypothetical protein